MRSIGLITSLLAVAALSAHGAENFDNHAVVLNTEWRGNQDWHVTGNSNIDGTLRNVGQLVLEIDGHSTVTLRGQADKIVIHSMGGQSEVNLLEAHVNTLEIQTITGQSIVQADVQNTLTIGSIDGQSTVCYVKHNPLVKIVPGKEAGDSRLVALDATAAC